MCFPRPPRKKVFFSCAAPKIRNFRFSGFFVCLARLPPWSAEVSRFASLAVDIIKSGSSGGMRTFKLKKKYFFCCWHCQSVRRVGTVSEDWTEISSLQSPRSFQKQISRGKCLLQSQSASFLSSFYDVRLPPNAFCILRLSPSQPSRASTTSTAASLIPRQVELLLL